MTPIRCPYCGVTNAETVRDAKSFVCPGCGKAIEQQAGQPVAPPLPAPPRNSERWSDGPPAESADRWSPVPPLGDEDSSPSVSVSQSSIIPRREAEPPPLVRPPRSPLVWLLAILVAFLAALIGVIVLARSVKPWLDERRAAAERASVDYWIPRLENGSDDERNEAARAIVTLGPPALVVTLERISEPSHDPAQEQSFAFVTAAVQALAAAGPDAVPALRAGLRSPQAKVRAAAADVVETMGPPGRAACPDLIAALDDENRGVRAGAIDALKSLGCSAAPAAKRLAEIVAAPDAFGRRRAAEALGRIGPDARDALPALEAVAKSKASDAPLRDAAQQAISQIDVLNLARAARRESSGKLKQLLKDLLGEDAKRAIEAAETLGEMGFAAQPAVAGLAAMLHDPAPTRRVAAAVALGKLGLAATDFVPTLESTATGDDDASVRAAAATALALINGKPK